MHIRLTFALIEAYFMAYLNIDIHINLKWMHDTGIRYMPSITASIYDEFSTVYI